MPKVYLPVIVLFLFVFGSCNRTLYPSDMFKVKDEVVFAPIEDLLIPVQPVIQPGDNLSISVYSNKGEKMLDPLSTASQQIGGESVAVSFTVNDLGYVELPLIGSMQVVGKTIEQCEKDIAALYAKSVVDPYVSVTAMNKRVFFLTGGSTQAGQAIPYVNENTTLIDVITLAGGIKEGKAYSIRLLRNSSTGLKIYDIDLSDFFQAKYSFIKILPNDIVYVEPQHRPLRKVVESLAPYLTLVSTGLLIYNLTR